jgi:hypothetical protein
MVFFLPCLSPKLPKRAPPTGLITKVTVYVANIASRLSVGSFDGAYEKHQNQIITIKRPS